MNPTLAIVTGASRGLGRAMTLQLLQSGHRVLAIARRAEEQLPDHPSLTTWSLDLADAPAAAARLQAWLSDQPASDALLINNAATLSAPSPLREGDADELSLAVRVGLEAPLLLCAAFLHATAAWGSDRRVLNISSGLGRRAMAGSASYCAVKAGMDHFSRAVALEEAERPGGARIVSLAPGIIDTDMQVQLRSANRQQFPEGEKFAAFKAQGQLDSPEAAAAKVLAFLARADFGSEVITDVRAA